MDDIIERKPSSPVTTSLLAVSTVALLASIVLGSMHVSRQMIDGKPATTAAKTFYDSKLAPLHKKAAKLSKE